MFLLVGVLAAIIERQTSGRAMAEAALALCTSDRDGLNGKVHKSLTLLERLGLPVRTLDGKTLL